MPERDAPRAESVSKPWGWKATLSVYVKGGQEDIEAVLDTLEGAVQCDDIYFAGISAERVDDEPRDQVAT
jgi:hypothetical protein